MVSIPVRGRVESLNVSVAAAVLLFEAARQRAEARVASAGDASGAADGSADLQRILHLRLRWLTEERPRAYSARP